MRYLNTERFLVTSNDKEGRQNYKDNYDRIFGEKRDETPTLCLDCQKPIPEDELHEVCAMGHIERCCACYELRQNGRSSGDGIEMKVKYYANLIVPLEAQQPVYYAHPIWFYNTDREREDIEEICRQLGSVLNPNAPEHEAGYQKRKASTGSGMGYFLEDVLPMCRSCVFRADYDGSVSSGVALEVKWFAERGLPTYELTPEGSLVPAVIDPTRVLTIDESRRRCGKRP